MKPFFSIVISVYNKASFIEQTLKSVVNQTFTDFEIIIVDDGSTDNSLEVIKGFKDDRISVFATENQGVSAARNFGVLKANAAYIALLDGDDTWKIDYLECIQKAILKFPDKKIFTVHVAQNYGHKIVPLDYSFKQDTLYSIHNFFEASQKYSILTSSSIVFNKSILKKTGLFDTSIVSGEDVDMWIRFGLFFDVVFINKLLVLYNYNPLSLSNTTFDLSKKPKFDKYLNEEKKHKLLKIFLDRNRYSMAIMGKLQNDKKSFNYYRNHLDLKSLNTRRKILLKSPKWLLQFLLKILSLKGEKLYYPNN